MPAALSPAVGPTARIAYLVSISSLCPFSFVEIYAKLIPWTLSLTSAQHRYTMCIYIINIHACSLIYLPARFGRWDVSKRRKKYIISGVTQMISCIYYVHAVCCRLIEESERFCIFRCLFSDKKVCIIYIQLVISSVTT